mmetsp:Transcript_34073/g.84973  ORF Transcript_34073/g.84973 Transcript_34073/m.84973 type:complete len:224 (+) Transcript_34073:479-1150(+)
MPHRRGHQVASVRLRRAARPRNGTRRGGGWGSRDLPAAGGPRHRPDRQAQGVQPAAAGPRHRRCESDARPRGRRARLRGCRADSGGVGGALDTAAYQQSAEDRAAHVARDSRGRARAARAGGRERAQRHLPAHQGRAHGPHVGRRKCRGRRAYEKKKVGRSASAASLLEHFMHGRPASGKPAPAAQLADRANFSCGTSGPYEAVVVINFIQNQIIMYSHFNCI